MHPKFEYKQTFNFEKSGIKIQTEELPYTRRTGASAGVILQINSECPGFDSGKFYIRISSGFATKGKTLKELYSLSYRETDIEQARGLNKLTHLIEIVEGNKYDDEALVLQNLVKHIKSSLLNSSPLKLFDENNNPIKLFVIPGFRVDEQTFELTDIGSNLSLSYM